MSLWVKICANTSLEDARLAADAGADAVGFVFAPSPRRVTAEQVAAITPLLPEWIEKIGVFVDSTPEEIEDTVRICGLTGVQLHCNAAVGATAFLRERFGPKLHILRVVHFGPEAAEKTAALAQEIYVDSVLVDSKTATAVGGTGVTFDWRAASDAVFQNSGIKQARLIAAGGLRPENVAEAIALMRPWGVDVASGVEAGPGRKDPAKVQAFVRNARLAAESLRG